MGFILMNHYNFKIPSNFIYYSFMPGKKNMFKYGSKQISARIITLSYPDGLFTIALSIFWINKNIYIFMLRICIVFWLLMLVVSLKYRINSAKNLTLTGNFCHKGFWAFQTLYFIWNFSIFVYIIAAHFQKLFELFVFLLSQISLEYLIEKNVCHM